MTTAKARQAAQPFLFLGAGFGTSRKCLECQLVFERSPSPEEQTRIETLLPPALGHVKRWRGAVLDFGSDDALEGHVSRTRLSSKRCSGIRRGGWWSGLGRSRS
jgi:hypothetical protein